VPGAPSASPPPWAGPEDGLPRAPGLKGGNARTGPLPLHPMSFGDLIDGVFRLLRANARALAPLLLVLAVPFEALSAYATRNSAGLSQVLSNLADLQNRQFSLSTTDLVLSVVAELGIFLMTPVVAGVVCRTVAISYIGEQPGSRQVSRLGARLLLALVVASVMVHALELVASVLCLLPGLVVMALFVLTAPAIVLEGLGPVAGMRRSWRLVKRRFWPVLGTALLGGLMASLAVSLVGLLPDSLAALASPHVRAVLDAVVGTFTEAFEWALVTMLATLLYFDQRIRQEGLDLEVMAARAR